MITLCRSIFLLAPLSEKRSKRGPMRITNTSAAIPPAAWTWGGQNIGMCGCQALIVTRDDLMRQTNVSLRVDLYFAAAWPRRVNGRHRSGLVQCTVRFRVTPVAPEFVCERYSCRTTQWVNQTGEPPPTRATKYARHTHSMLYSSGTSTRSERRRSRNACAGAPF